MSSETLANEVTHAGHDEHAEGHAHPADRQYVVIALILAFFTAVEVLTYFVDFGAAAVPTLLGLMVIKFVMVVLYFMHLKFDSPVFMRLFAVGLLLAVSVYFIMFAAFQFGE
ncbi:MAG TPA: cytochrome C oxidase subunit IV family protein [Acidimicrobiales bacterium]|nr:cytochrome C oxidase subunit IV family protein [Acidimicrobiales bacterium]